VAFGANGIAGKNPLPSGDIRGDEARGGEPGCGAGGGVNGAQALACPSGSEGPPVTCARPCAQEALDGLAVDAPAIEHELERHGLVEREVVRGHDHAHASTSELPLDAVFAGDDVPDTHGRGDFVRKHPGFGLYRLCANFDLLTASV
jgi:hypothetical protein